MSNFINHHSMPSYTRFFKEAISVGVLSRSVACRKPANYDP
ncbi:MAG: hypothetical protein ACI89U_001010, partial [Gammaproteobacteria bacterium]